jgi:hypothetical protein
MDAFAEFVCNAHSWYKHLPLLPPGRPLQFYVDAAAGMQLRSMPDGRVLAEPRLEPGFHYSWLRTAEYRERFGYLAFSREHGTIVSLYKGDGSQLVASDDAHRYFDCSAGGVRPLPSEVLRAGRAFVSAVIHTMGSREFVSTLDSVPADFSWPEQSGGAATLAQILERAVAI